MNEKPGISRRDFVRNLAIGAGGLVFIGSFGVYFRFFDDEKQTIKGIIVDYSKCTGCRTCETVCSAFNHKDIINGEKLNGLGNPNLSNIRVHHYNPDVDIPMVCSICEDSPCINACPIPPDLVTGRKAMYHEPKTNTVRNDKDRCIGCGQCAKACHRMRTGVINRYDNGKPFGMCTLCEGEPNCVKYCSYNALSFVELTSNTRFRKLPPDMIAKEMIKTLYEMELQ
jgi:anaerobic carbon-monoxide dehydrogenase iron sulfur subunit